ncbi:hypothetical protein ACEUAT_07495 [Aeromonas veronii]
MGKLPLPEYCTVERASRLLGCEVEDLLHWGVEGLITLMINLDSWRDEEEIELAEMTMEAGIPMRKVQPENFASDHVSISSRTGYFISHDHDLGEGRFASLYGFWIVQPNTIQDRYFGFEQDELHLIATPNNDALIDEKDMTTAIMPIAGHLLPTYWISKKQMEILLSGESLTPRFSWGVHNQSEKSSNEPPVKTKRVNTTNKQARAIVELLHALGFNPADYYKGKESDWIGMQRDLGTKGIGGELIKITPKTLQDWLQRGGGI